MKITVIAIEALLSIPEKHITHGQQYVVLEEKYDNGFREYVITADDGSLQVVTAEHVEDIGWEEELTEDDRNMYELQKQ